MVLELESTYGSDVRPPRVNGSRKLWAKDPSGPDANDGTRLDATFVNDLIGLIRGLLAAYEINATPGDDTALAQAVAAAIAGHTHSVADLEDSETHVRMTVEERQKLAALVTNYKGRYSSLAALAAAVPTANAGDWAILTLPGEPASIAVWDADAEPAQWVSAIQELIAETLSVAKAQSLSAAQVAQARKNLQLSTGPLAGYRNKIINGDGRVNQRVATTIGDDTYGHDRHYALTQSGNIAVSTVSAPADGIAFMMRLTQAQATAQRMGYAQIIEAAETYGLRGKLVTLGGKLRYSNAAAIRFAVLEWTGTADQVTSDVVNDWASGSYAAGDFFIGTNLTVAAVGAITPAANEITDWSITAAISSSANNLIVFFWTEGTAAQNSTLDMRWYLVEGDATAEDDPFSPRHIQQELALCQRYFGRTWGSIRGPCSAAGQYLSNLVQWPVEMRAPPTVTAQYTTEGNVLTRNVSSANMLGVRFEIVSAAAGDTYSINARFEADAEL